jgi:hypothetical protein
MGAVVKLLSSFFVSITSMCLYSAPSCAEYTGVDLLRDCRTAIVDRESSTIEKAFQAGRCYGIVIGIAQAGSPKGLWGNVDPARFCIQQSNVRNENLIKLVVTYLTTHPEVLGAKAAELVIVAMTRNFPCR